MNSISRLKFDKKIALFQNIKKTELYHPLDGITNLKYKLLCFLTPNRKKLKEKGTSF